jgi:hypothetical protein
MYGKRQQELFPMYSMSIERTLFTAPHNKKSSAFRRMKLNPFRDQSAFFPMLYRDITVPRLSCGLHGLKILIQPVCDSLQ